MTPQELKEEAQRICICIQAVKVEEREEALVRELNKLSDPNIRDALLSIVTVTVSFTRETTEKRMATWEKITLGVGGAVFLIVLLVVAIAIPNPTPFQLVVFRLILSIAAASCAAMIPGSLDISGKLKKFTLRAGGALAVFVLVYCVNPPALIVQHLK